MPGAIVVIALGLLLWSNQRESGRIEQLQGHFERLCAHIMAGGDPAGRIIADSPAKREAFTETLRETLGEVDEPQALGIEAESGDTSPWPDGRATHTVHIRVDGRPRLGVRIRGPRAGTIEVIGYWMPDMPEPPPDEGAADEGGSETSAPPPPPGGSPVGAGAAPAGELYIRR